VPALAHTGLMGHCGRLTPAVSFCEPVFGIRAAHFWLNPVQGRETRAETDFVKTDRVGQFGSETSNSGRGVEGSSFAIRRFKREDDPMRLISVAPLALLLVLPLTASAQGSLVQGVGGEPTSPQWFKGNTHAHANLWFPIPHGDTGPKKLAEWYQTRGYNFLCISDHNKVGRERRARSVENESFILISGTEVTSDTRVRIFYRMRHRDAPKRVVHTTAFNIDLERWDNDTWKDFGPESSVLDILRTHREATERAGGLTIVNHPNFKGHIGADELIQSGAGLFELYNAYPHAKNQGHGDDPSTEEVWDQVLSSGYRLYGVASDDAHDTKEWSRRITERLKIRAPAGGAWIMVRAASLTPSDIASAMRSGDFYASSGVHLSRLDVADGRLSLAVDLAETEAEAAKDYVWAPAREPMGDEAQPGTRITFVTQGGRILASSQALDAEVSLAAADLYVRARVSHTIQRNGETKVFHAWTQPVFLD
jgi:hypothetical protein